MRPWLRRGLGTLALVGLLMGAAVAWNQFQRGVRGWRAFEWMRLDPLGLHAFPGTDPAPAPDDARPRLVLFGDSRAAQWPAATLAHQAQVINRGIGGQTTAQILGRFDRHVVPLQPDILVIQAGVNDLKTLPWFPEERDTIVARCRTNLETLVAEARAAGIPHIIITTIFPRGAPAAGRQWVAGPEVDAAIAEVNDALRALAGNGVAVLDAARLLAGPDGRVRPEYRRDLLHLNPTGYFVISEELLSIDALKL